MDIGLSLVGITLSAPVVVVCCFLIYLSDGGNPIFSQRRLGKGEKEFTLYKLRTMKVGTQHVATHLVSSGQVNSIGAFLRKIKLDELPQLFNVVKGDMSLVGPRPGLPNQHELTQCRRRFGIFQLKPGITGLSQIEDIDMSDPERLARSDSRYLEDGGIMDDLRIILYTLLGRGAKDRLREESR